MTVMHNSIDRHISQLIDVTVDILRAQTLLEAASQVIEDMDRPDLWHTLNVLKTTLEAADTELGDARRKVVAICAICGLPRD